MTENESPQRNRYHLVMFLTEQNITRSLVYSIQKQLDAAITATPEDTEIDIWIESGGGDAHAAYKLFLDLRSRCVRLRAVIPDYAKSAATLLMLGMDKIYMAPSAELGPLDVQLEHPDREGTIVSGLDIADSYAFLINTAVDMAIVGGLTILQYTRLTRHTVLHETLQFMAQFLQPAVSKLDPHLIHQAIQDLNVAEGYAIRMLEKRNLPDGDRMDTVAASELMKQLVNHYPTHGFIIGVSEAKKLGLPIEDARVYPRWTQVKRLYDGVISSGESLICVLPDSMLDSEIDSELESMALEDDVYGSLESNDQEGENDDEIQSPENSSEQNDQDSRNGSPKGRKARG